MFLNFWTRDFVGKFRTVRFKGLKFGLRLKSAIVEKNFEIKKAKHFPIVKNTALPAGSFDGKVAFITGGGTGLGKGMSKKFAELGATVVISSRKLDVLEATANEINETNPAGKVLPGLYLYQTWSLSSLIYNYRYPGLNLKKTAKWTYRENFAMSENSAAYQEFEPELTQKIICLIW